MKKLFALLYAATVQLALYQPENYERDDTAQAADGFFRDLGAKISDAFVSLKGSQNNEFAVLLNWQAAFVRGDAQEAMQMLFEYDKESFQRLEGQKAYIATIEGEEFIGSIKDLVEFQTLQKEIPTEESVGLE